MNAKVQLFAAARDRIGADTVEVTLPENGTVGDLRAILASSYPNLEPIASHLLFAIDDGYGTDDSIIPPNARLACFPPVSGG